ncbi:MAG: hypothetical protein NZ849_06240 [Meiothermus sp.]|uniref:PIN domain-containing protein n=1 Tax=Meiothermus sp. TaxID=1955249 RepID=UPI0025F87D9B|nr:PIN domain-containing protein [Meiothermus sp.]MCS7194498.1 hypothetical protein [Meiothermus sp.]
MERAPEARRRALEGWVQRVKRGFAGRILPLDGEVMEIWGRLTGISLREGHPLSPLDAMLVATALRHGLTPVTRNTAHFRGLPLSLENPWDERG